MEPTIADEPGVFSETCQAVLQEASELFSKSPDWVTFFRQVLGQSGIVRRSFPTPGDLTEFEKTPAYAGIQQMLTELRRNRVAGPGLAERIRVITVRLPQSLYDRLHDEAHEYRTSMNRLCISKLMMLIDEEFVPPDRSPPCTTDGHGCPIPGVPGKEAAEQKGPGVDA